MGRDRYASILEIVTPGVAGFEPETAAGRANIIGAMTDAVNLAAAIEAATILAETGRAPATAVFNRAADDVAPAGVAPYNVSNTQFIDNILAGNNDGITAHLSGFRQFFHGESVDPAAARGGDYHRGGVGQREGAIFEMRNMIPADALNLPTDRFPRGRWVGLATHMVDMIAALNARTVAQSARDTRYRQATGALYDEGAN